MPKLSCVKRNEAQNMLTTSRMAASVPAMSAGASLCDSQATCRHRATASAGLCALQPLQPSSATVHIQLVVASSAQSLPSPPRTTPPLRTTYTHLQREDAGRGLQHVRHRAGLPAAAHVCVARLGVLRGVIRQHLAQRGVQRAQRAQRGGLHGAADGCSGALINRINR